MAVTTEDIVKKEFSRSLMGYDMQEVDVFLDAIIDRVEKMELERDELVAAMEKLLKRVERLEKTKENAAVEGGEGGRRKLPASSAPVASGPVHVQGGKGVADVVEEETPARRERVAQQKKRPQDTVKKEAPAYAKPIRPAAQPQPATETRTTANQPPRPEEAESASVASAPVAVAIEMETGIQALDEGELLPDLINDIESALLDGSIRPASHKDAPVRAADQSRVS